MLSLAPDLTHRANIVDYLLLSNIVLALVIFFINYNTLRLLVVNATSLIILCFCVNMFVVNHIENKVNGFFPFLGFFGPLYVFHLRKFNGIKTSFKLVVIHLVPAIFFISVFFYLLLFYNMKESMKAYYWLIILQSVSFFLYGIYGLITNHTIHSKRLKEALSIVGAVYILSAVFTMNTSYAAIQLADYDTQNLHYVNDYSYFATSVLGWAYFFIIVALLIHPEDLIAVKSFALKPKNSDGQGAIGEGEPIEAVTLAKPLSYKKGRLDPEKLATFEKKLDKLMQKEQVFLVPDLSLTTLARILKISNHHLTQVLSIQKSIKFYEYINKLRILYAVEIIDKGRTEINFEVLAMECGFNNRVSFNRYFKEVTGLQPSVYLKSKSTTVD